jgi:hypothetical protein
MLADPNTTNAQTPVLQGVSLSALLNRIKGIIDAQLSEPVWVRAEIRRVQTARSGHVYLELEERDANGQTIASTKGVIWQGKFTSLQGVWQRFATKWAIVFTNSSQRGARENGPRAERVRSLNARSSRVFYYLPL